MIDLIQYIKESLLDDFDDLEISSDNAIRSSILNNKDFIKHFGGGWEISGDSLIRLKDAKLRDLKTLEVRKDFLLSNFFDDSINQIIFNDRYPKLSSRLLTPQTLCKTIKCNGVNGKMVLNTLVITDMDIESASPISITHTFDKIRITNTNIKFTGSEESKTLNFITEELPILSNVISNATRIRIHDTFFFDKYDQFDQVLDLPYTCKVKDTKKNDEIVDVKIKTFKKIHAIVNNSKRYILLEPLIRFKPGNTINDLINITGFKDLETITMNNNNVEMVISKQMYYDSTLYDHFKLGDFIGLIKKHK